MSNGPALRAVTGIIQPKSGHHRLGADYAGKQPSEMTEWMPRCYRSREALTRYEEVILRDGAA